MLIKIFLMPVFSFLFSQELLFTLGKKDYYDYDFFSMIPYSEWSVLDSTKQRMAKNSFLEKELVFFESTLLGLSCHGKTYIALEERKNQLLINYAYESLIAIPLITQEAFSAGKQNILKKRLVNHLLLGYKGCKMSGDFSITKKEAFVLASQIKEKIESSFKASPDSLKASLFKDFALLESKDPSVVENQGTLGWVSWGQTVQPFQEAVFSLSLGQVSPPILTDFGYHLIFVEEEAPSDLSYYNPSLLDGFVKKTCLQSLDFERLKSAAVSFDSSLVSAKNLFINRILLKDLFFTIENNTKKKKLRGNKNSYIKWLEEKNYSDVFFIYEGRSFGVGWFIYMLQKTPATRIPSIKKEEDVLSLLKSFVLREAVLAQAKEKNLQHSIFFKNDFLKHKKNILQKKHSSFLVNSLAVPDSIEVASLYNKGLFKKQYIKPRSVVYSEIKKSSEEEINMAYNHYLNEKDFEKTLKLFGGKIKNPITQGTGGPLSITAFQMRVGEISPPIENRNKTFSLIRIEKFIEEEPFSLDKVYNQIERKLIKERQDSVKFNTLKTLKNKHSIKTFNL